MSSQPLLEGHTEAEDVTRLRRKCERLEATVESLESELAEARREAQMATKPLRNLKRQLEPFYTAMRAIFGELDVISGGNGDGEQVAPRKKEVWESWKNRLGGGTAKVIDALLLHREMNTTQLAIATGLHRTTIPALIFKLNQAGLINKNGGRFSLKEM